MQNLSITVLMTVYNGGHFLKMAIESVLAQTFSDFEFLIIDDCSTDNSVEIIESFKDSRITLFKNIKNIGQTKSLNVGFQMAKGQFIGRIDADDFAFPIWVERQIEFLRENEASIISPNLLVIDELSKAKRELKIPQNHSEIILRSMVRSPINHGGSFMDRNVVLKIGGYDENLRITADYALWSKLLRNNCKLACVKETLMAIRFHEGSVSVEQRLNCGLFEISSLMRENIEWLTKCAFSDEDISLLYKAYYDERNVTNKEFDCVMEIVEKIEKGIKINSQIEECFVSEWIKNQRKVIYLKRIFFFIKSKKFSRIREFSYSGFRKCSGKNILVGMYLMSFLGGVFLKWIPILFQFYSRQKVRLSLLGKSYGKAFS